MEVEKSIYSGRRQEMRERFSMLGFFGYQPHEVLEQYLYDVIPRGNTNETAHLLLQRFGTLDGVFTASKNELITIRGIGEKSANYILSLYPEIGRMMLEQYKSADSFSSYEMVIMFDWFIKVCRDDRIFVTLIGTSSRLLDFHPISNECDDIYSYIRELIVRFSELKIMYLVAKEREKLPIELILSLSALTDNVATIDGMYLSDSGFTSVTHPEKSIQIYKKPSKKSVSIKKLLHI